ncbi:MAG: helicase-associated domain-containing protein [Planctomycetota bacterium]
MTTRRNGHDGVPLAKHLKALRVADLRDVYAFWQPDEPAQNVKKPQLVAQLGELMSDEGIVYRRVRTLTRKVLDVLLLMLRRGGYASDLPGLFQRLPGEEAFKLEYHEAEAGVKALLRRGFLAEVNDRGMAGNGRVLYAVPEELGGLLTTLFREETRTVASVFLLAEHTASITAAERGRLQARFPAVEDTAGPGDVRAILGDEKTKKILARVDPPLRRVVEYVARTHGGVVLRSEWSSRQKLRKVRWDRDVWRTQLEESGIGTLGRLQLKPYGIACDDEALAIFDEVLERFFRDKDEREPKDAELLRSGGDLVADLCAFLEHVRRHPVKVGRNGEVHKTGRRRIQEAFVFRESVLAGPSEIWSEVVNASQHLDLAGTDAEGFLELRPGAERFLAQPLEGKVQDLYRMALEQAGDRGRSLHQREMRTVVSECLREEPERWWSGRALAAVARHRYLATLDRRGIRERHRDRAFSSWFTGRETPRDLMYALQRHWFPRLFVLGILNVALRDDRPIAWKLSPLGARVLGAARAGLDTGLRPILVNPDFEVLVLPEGDVSDVVHTLDGYAQRVKSEDVVHFRLTRGAIEAAVGAGRPVETFLEFLEARSRGGLPQNVAFTIRRWAEHVTFAQLERGVVLRVGDEAALDRILAVPGMAKLLARRIGPMEALLREEPKDRRLLATLQESGIHLQGP